MLDNVTFQLLLGIWHGPIHPDIHDRIWIYARADREKYEGIVREYRQSEGIRIAFGEPGSGSFAMAVIMNTDPESILAEMRQNRDLGRS